MKPRMAARGLQVPEGSALDRIMSYHGLTYREAQYIEGLMEEDGWDFEQAYDEGAMLKQAEDHIYWVNKNGDWP